MDAFPTSPEALRRSQIFKEGWYYSIELMPDILTRGRGHQNVALTRRLLRHCEVQNQTCLDMGTMEGMIPVLLRRRGAKKVVAVDVRDLSERIRCVQHYLSTDFEYVPNLTHNRTFDVLKERGLTNFDIVVLSGVLYHVFDPMRTLAIARSLVRSGGLMVVETAAAVDRAYGMSFNVRGTVYDNPGDFWFMTVPMLDYLLRYFKLAPLDTVFFGPHRFPSSFKHCRVAVVCRAVDYVPAPADDLWIQRAVQAVDYVTLMHWQASENPEQSHVVYSKEGRSPFLRDDTKTCDLMAAVRRGKSMKCEADDVVLRLGASY
jgi:2-polyprenyl-3-methyl-5-hydroxy-6-metoxy-1,4-benzoquinol methylase